MFTVSSGFIGIFKTGDNINYNLKCLRELYEAQGASPVENKNLFCKPITLILVSIIEALLHDLFFRIVNYTRESIRNIASDTLKKIRTKKIDQLGSFVASAKKYDLLDAIGTGLYEQLDSLRRLRNRIHIQNTKYDHPLDENRAFTMTQQRIAEEVLERVLKLSSEKYQRPSHAQGFVDDFELPWDERLL